MNAPQFDLTLAGSTLLLNNNDEMQKSLLITDLAIQQFKDLNTL
jgi:hypothetical protein